MDEQRDELFEAFVEGFKQAGEGYNAEYPFRFNDDDIRESLKPRFESWRGE